MKSKQFPTFNEAMEYLKERGELEYFGRIGQHAETYVYNLKLPTGMIYHLLVHDDGKVEVLE